MKLTSNKPLLIILSVVSGFVFTAGVIAVLYYRFDVFKTDNASDNNIELVESEEVIVRSSLSKDDFDFIYYGPDNELFYSGTVTGTNGCAQLGEIGIEQKSDEVILIVPIEYEGQVCTQVIRELLVQGSVSIALTENEAESLEQTLKVEVR
jgi:hypothetical protein